MYIFVVMIICKVFWECNLYKKKTIPNDWKSQKNVFDEKLWELRMLKKM